MALSVYVTCGVFVDTSCKARDVITIESGSLVKVG